MKVTRDIIRPTLVLVIITMLISGIVAVVYNLTKVEKGPGMSEGALAKASELLGTDQLTAVTSSKFTEEVQGAVHTDEGEYALSVLSKGYGGDMELVVAFQSDDTIKGVAIVSAQETPGIGTKVTEGTDFTERFIGKSGPLELGTQIDGITGATVSSKAVTAGVNTAVENLPFAKEGLAERKGED